MTIMPVVKNVQVLTDNDIYAAVFDFIEKFGKPDLPVDKKTGRIFRAGTSRMVLPKDNEYVVMQILNQQRIGTNVETYVVDDPAYEGTLTAKELVEVNIQIDCYSDPNTARDFARQRAHALAIAANSSMAEAFFNGYTLHCNGSTDPQFINFIGDAEQYVNRYMITLNLTYIFGMTGELPYIDNANVIPKNVDVEFPPNN